MSCRRLMDESWKGYKVTEDVFREARVASTETVAIRKFVSDCLKRGLNPKVILEEDFINSSFAKSLYDYTPNVDKFNSTKSAWLKHLGARNKDNTAQKTQSVNDLIQANTEQAMPVNLSSKTLAMMDYAEERGEEIADNAGTRCKRKYNKIYETVAMSVSEKVSKNSAIIAGQAGVGKTFYATKILEEKGLKPVSYGTPTQNQYYYQKGSIGTSRESIVWFFYQHRNKEIIVLDDCDSFLVNKDQTIQNVLKAILTQGKNGGDVGITDLNLRRKLSKMLDASNKQMVESIQPKSTKSKLLESLDQLNKLYNDGFDEENDNLEAEEELSLETLKNTKEVSTDSLSFPETFHFTSKVVIISNLNLKQIDSAVSSRSNFCEIYLEPDEFLYKLKEIASTLGLNDTPLAEKEFVWHRDLCIEVLEIAIECALTSTRLGSLSFEINSPLEFRNVITLTDYSIAKTLNVDVFEMSEKEKQSHKFKLLVDCAALLSQVL